MTISLREFTDIIISVMRPNQFVADVQNARSPACTCRKWALELRFQKTQVMS